MYYVSMESPYYAEVPGLSEWIWRLYEFILEQMVIKEEQVVIKEETKISMVNK